MALKKFVMVKFLNDTMVDPPISEVRQGGCFWVLLQCLVLVCSLMAEPEVAEAEPNHRPDTAGSPAGAGESPLISWKPFSNRVLVLIPTVVWVLQKWPSQGDHPAEGDLAVHRGVCCWG